MSAFIPTDGPALDDTEVGNIPFFPALRVTQLRAAMRVVEAIPAERVKWELKRAILATNRELHTWREAQEAEGHATLQDVPADSYDAESELVTHYTAAVFHRAKGFLIEKGRDMDLTNEGVDGTEHAEEAVEDHFRHVREALTALMGQPRATIELI